MSKKKQQQTSDDPNLTKEEDAYARFLRFNCPTKVGTCNSNEFHYFVGSKAIETLLESNKYGANAKTPIFKTKGDCEAFIGSLVRKGAVFRAKKHVLKKKSPGEKKKKELKDTPTNSPKTKREKQVKEQEEKKEESDSGTDANKEKDDSEEKKDKKKKILLTLTPNQSFTTDTSDVYAWVFDPTPLYKKVIGILMLLGTILGCLFPLWPDWLRLGVYYTSMGGCGLLGVLLATALARTALFGIIYAVTLGQHQLWILPNLTADCGFFESFQPFYTYEYCPGNNKKEKSKKKEKKDLSSANDDQLTENEEKKGISEGSNSENDDIENLSAEELENSEDEEKKEK